MTGSPHAPADDRPGSSRGSRHVEQASQLVTREATADSVVAGPDIDAHVAALQEYDDAGFDEAHVADMGLHWARTTCR